jgi:hypothetical protein
MAPKIGEICLGLFVFRFSHPPSCFDFNITNSHDLSTVFIEKGANGFKSGEKDRAPTEGEL